MDLDIYRSLQRLRVEKLLFTTCLDASDSIVAQYKNEMRSKIAMVINVPRCLNIVICILKFEVFLRMNEA